MTIGYTIWTLEAWHAALGAVPALNLTSFTWDRLGALPLFGPCRMAGTVDGVVLPAPQLAWEAVFWTGRTKTGTFLFGWKLDVAGVHRTVIVGMQVNMRSPSEIVASLAHSLLTPNHVKSIF